MNKKEMTRTAGVRIVSPEGSVELPVAKFLEEMGINHKVSLTEVVEKANSEAPTGCKVEKVKEYLH